MIPYSIFRLIIALVLGAVFYIVDRQGGTSLYRWWYGMTHEHPLPADINRGLVHNRGTKFRVIWATILASIIAIPAITYSQHNALLELALWIISIPAIVGAFMLGPRAWALWGKRDNVYTAVDRWEQGDEKQGQAVEMDSDKPADYRPEIQQLHQEEPEQKTEKAEASELKLKDPEDPQELVNKFINRGKS